MDYFNYQNCINSNIRTTVNEDFNNTYYNYHDNISTFQNCDPRLNLDISVQPVTAAVETKTDDELWIETWLSKMGKIHINLDSTIEIISTNIKFSKQKSLPQIHLAKNAIKNCLEIITKLEQAQNLLKENVASFSSFEWKEKTIEIGTLKNEFSKHMLQFENHDALLALNRAVKLRRKKRINQKKRKILHKEIIARNIEKCKLAHKTIDEWLENMKDAVERVKMEENMKKDADCVLAEVNKKKSEARKQVSLISALIKLRTVREQAAQHRGEKISQEDHHAFELITGHLSRMWENSLQVYSKEEQGLRVMLEQNALEDTKAANLARERNIIREWELVLFGPKCIPSSAYWGLTSADKDMDTFIAIRRSWDTFLNQHSKHGTKIPIGWILPETNASVEWRKYIKI